MVMGAIAGGLASAAGGSLLGGLLGGSDKQKTQTTNTPWNAKQLQELMKQAETRFEDGPNQYYPGSTVADLDPRLQQTLNQMMGFGDQPMVQEGQNALMQALQGNQGLMNQASQNQVQGVGDYASFLMNQGMNPDTGAVGNIAGQADPTQAYQQFLGGSEANPYIDQLVDQTTRDISQNLNENIMPRIDQGALANNAYGGSRQGVAQGRAIESANREAGDASSRIRSGAFESGEQRKLQAANSMLGAAGQGDRYTQALQQQGLQGAQMGRGLFQDLAGITGQQASMAPMLQAYEGQNQNTALQGGQLNQQFLQSLLSDDVNRFNFEQQADDQNFQNYANLLLQAGGMGGTQTQTANTPQASLGERLLGGAATGLGLYGQFGNLLNGGGGNTANAWASNTP